MMGTFYEFGKDDHMSFVDFRQAYDNIVRNKLWAALEEFGILKKPIDLIKACNTHTVCKVKFDNGTSDSFEVIAGLKQLDVLSPVLFNLALEVRSMPMRQSMTFLSNSMLLAYADDIVIIGSTRQDAVAIRANDLIKAAKPMGLEVNHGKTKYLVITRGTRDRT